MRTARSSLGARALPLALLAAPLVAQEPVLSEFQAANAGTLLDEDGDSSDWIELNNPAAAPVDLGGWFLTDDAGDLTRWTIPTPTVIPAGSFLVVFASGKDRTTIPLHTDFKLKAAGEYLALVRPDGTVATEYAPEYPPQVSDTSFGIPEPPGPPSYFVVPTPRAPNGPGGPLLLGVEHAPDSPLPGEDVVVRAEVPHLDPAGTVTLTWRLDFRPEQRLAMTDDGAGADQIAGDDVYSGLLPGTTFSPGDTLTADVDPFSHPFFGDEAHPKGNGKWNRLIDDLYTVPRIREMYLRRLRSLIDRLLQPPGTPEQERFLEGRLEQEYVRLLPDVELDRMQWGLPAWGRPHGMRLAVERIRDEYLLARREHLYGTHGPPAGSIPPPNPHPAIVIDWIEGDPASGDPAHEYVRLRNPGSLAGDLSGWRLGGAVAFTLEPGSVLEAGGVLYSSPDPSAFRSRPTPPGGGQGLLVIGPHVGSIEPGEWVRLYDQGGQLVDEVQY